jgi:hypothetical protein
MYQSRRKRGGIFPVRVDASLQPVAFGTAPMNVHANVKSTCKIQTKSVI